MYLFFFNLFPFQAVNGKRFSSRVFDSCVFERLAAAAVAAFVISGCCGYSCLAPTPQPDAAPALALALAQLPSSLHDSEAVMWETTEGSGR